MKEIWLIRHAESTANAGAVTSVPASIPITERGAEQAKCIADYFDKQPDLLVLSPYMRAQQSAAPLLERFPNTPTQAWNVQEFTYLASDRCVNTSFSDRKPLVAAYWERNEPEYCDGPGAESFAAFVSRAWVMLERIKTQTVPFTGIFTHGQFIQLTIWLLWHNLANPTNYSTTKGSVMPNSGSTITNESMASYRCFLNAIAIPNAAIVKLRYNGDLFFTSPITSHLPPNLIT